MFEPIVGKQPIACWLAAAALLAAGVVRAEEGTDDGRFLTGLRQRGLFELAETYCADKLNDPQLRESRRAELVVELSLTLTQRAVNSPPDQREPLWQRAWEVTDDFARQHPQNPRLPLVRYQGALGLVARGELARQESELVADNRPLLDEARTQLRTAVGRLEELNEDVAQRLRSARRPGPAAAAGQDGDRLAEYQLASLAKNVQYQLARTLRNQAQCYGPDTPDRANSLTRALAMLAPLAELDASHPLAFSSRLDRIVCDRLLGDYTTAARALAALAAEEPPPAVVLRARAERIRLALASGGLSQAVAVLAEGRKLDGATSPELDDAWLRTYLEAWRAAGRSGDGQASAAWQSKATEMVRRIEQADGPYWTRRAEMLLAGYVRTSPDGGDLEMRVRAAESSFRSGRLDDALAAYDRAREMAQQQGDAAQAFALGYTAAAIEHQRNHHAEAMARFRSLALGDPGRPKAAEAHLLAVYHAEQLAKTAGPDSLEAYVRLLQEHLEHWPDGPTADQVRWRLGRLREHRRDWQNAIAAYRAISPGSAEFGRVVEAAGRCYRAWLHQRQSAGQPTEGIAVDAAAWFESITPGSEDRPAQTWTPTARNAALEAARLWLNDTPSGFGRAERILSAAMAGAGDAPPEWKSAARAVLLLALAGQGRPDEAGEILGQISAGPPEGLLAVLEGLSHVVEAAGPEVKPRWAELALRAADVLDRRRGELDRADQETLDRLKAQALADAGRIDEALAAYQWLAKIHPRDGDLQEASARLLSTRQDRASLEAALAKWRELENGSRPGSDRWFRAKYEVARLHYRLGNRAETEKMIKLLEVLHPEMGGPEMKGRFLELLDRAKRKPPTPNP